jgi:DNA helicase HerA-like ATPase
LKKLGLIICDRDSPTSLKWSFQTYEGADTRVQEFVQVQVDDGYMLGKITSVRFYNDYFTDQTFVGHFIRNDKQVEERYPINKHMIKLAFVQSLGIWKEGKFHAPIVPPFPGAIVSEADPEIFSKYLGMEPEGLYLGRALNQEGIRILVDTNKLLSHHIAILGATGSGKSYTNGVLCEELLDLGVPIVVIDPHGEFESLGEKNTNPREVEEMKRFEVSQKSYKTREYAPSFARKNWQTALTVDIGKLETETIGELIGLNSDAQLDLLYLSIKTLIERFGKNELTIPRLLDFVEIVGKENSDNRTMMAVKRRISVLSRLGIFGKGFDSKELVQKGTLTVLDLSEDVEERLKRALCAAILNTLFEARKNKEIPPFLLVVEESHRFCPQDDDCASKQVIRRLTREGRKFGVGVCLTSQRVIGLDKDSFSQCGTKITLRIDNKSDLDYIRPYLGLSNSEEFDIIPTLPEGIAVISGICVRTPIVFRVRVRKSMHKGESAQFVIARDECI